MGEVIQVNFSTRRGVDHLRLYRKTVTLWREEPQNSPKRGPKRLYWGIDIIPIINGFAVGECIASQKENVSVKFTDYLIGQTWKLKLKRYYNEKTGKFVFVQERAKLIHGNRSRAV